MGSSIGACECRQRPKLSNGGQETHRLQPRRPAAVSCSPLGRVLNQSEQFIEVSYLSMRTAHRVRGPERQHIVLVARPAANVGWHNELLQLMITNGLKGDL